MIEEGLKVRPAARCEHGDVERTPRHANSPP
jgi:hypothetical protein